MVGRKCCATGCQSKMNGKTAIMFHRFPYKDPERVAEWLKVCPPGLEIKSSEKYRLCSKHFRRDQYLNFNVARPTLVHNAVPFIPRSSKKSPNKNYIEKPLQRLGSPALISEPHKEIEDESGDVTVEVIMKDAISVEKDARLPAANRPKSPSTTHEALIMETVQLKTRNQELLAQLKKYEQRLALMEGHVHRLSRLAGEADDCVCALCTSFSLI